MTLDSSSLDIVAAAALFATAIGAWMLAAPLSLRARLYLRFAAVLLSALAISVPLHMADVTGLLLLPLASAALMIGALARFAKPLPVLPACLALVLGQAGGLGAVISGNAMLALVPVMVAGLVVIAAAIHDIAVMPVLAGAGLIASGLAFMQQGVRGGLLLFCASALIGLVRPQLLRSSSSAMRDEVSAAISRFHHHGPAPVGHRLTKELGDKGRNQARSVPKRVEAGRVIAIQALGLNVPHRFVPAAVAVGFLPAQGAGCAGFLDRARGQGAELLSLHRHLSQRQQSRACQGTRKCGTINASAW